jgi:hypothetical protein
MGTFYELAEAIKGRLDEQAAAVQAQAETVAAQAAVVRAAADAVAEQQVKSEALAEAAILSVAPLVRDPNVDLSDEKLAVMATLFPVWRVGEAVKVGDVRSWADTLVECLQAHTTQSDWTPDKVPALWKIHRAAGAAPAPWVQPLGGHDAYKIGDRVTFNGKVYESAINGNVWSPTAYPAGWKVVT